MRMIGASLSEPHLVSSTAALYIYIILFLYILYIPQHRTSSTRARDHLFNTCTVYSRSQIKTRPTPAHAVGMDYQEDPHREARLAVEISSLEVSSICDSADRSPICGPMFTPSLRHDHVEGSGHRLRQFGEFTTNA